MDNNLDSKFSKCSIDGCENDAFIGHDECILHCPKGDIIVAFYFYKEFKNYMLKLIKTFKKDTGNEELNQFLKKQSLALYLIEFTDRDTDDSFDYLKILELFGKINFTNCKFYTGYLPLKGVEVHFSDCVFYDEWLLLDFKLSREEYSIYSNCKFKKNTYTAYGVSQEASFLKHTQFDGFCSFEKELMIHNTTMEGLLFCMHEPTCSTRNSSIKFLKIENAIFKNRFALEEININKIEILSAVFEDRFDLIDSKVGEIDISHTNFKKLTNFFGTKFIKFSITKSIFDDFVGFEQCEFGQDKNKKNIAAFTHVTFIGFINFRNAKFLSGLDLSMTNLKEYPNFLNTDINKRFTNRETFRIIKYSFLKLGNTIESNKFYAKELEKYKEELDSKNYSFFNQERLIYFFNKHISNFGQSYFKPIFLFIIVSIVHYCTIRCYEANMLYKICEPLNSVAKNITPFKLMMTEGIEFLSILFGVIYSILLWHIIVAVKAHTRKSD